MHTCFKSYIVVNMMMITFCHGQVKYIDTNLPGMTPQKFAPGVITMEDESEFGSVFNRDGTEFFYAIDIDGKAEIRYTKLSDSGWSTPIAIFKDELFGYNDPFLSTDEGKLYFISDRPSSAHDTLNDINIWYSVRVGSDWSEPIDVGDQINSPKQEYYISFSADGSMYFASNKNADPKRQRDFDIYKSLFSNGIFQQPERLSDSINSRRYEADVFIAPDESYIIYATARKDGFGSGDLYISFKNDSDVWQKSKNMGSTINTSTNELCPFVSHNGEYFFYTSNQDIYWVSTKIFNRYR